MKIGGKRHGRKEVEPSQPQVQDEVQNPELERVRAWSQEPRRRHDLAEQGDDRRLDTTEERSARRPATLLEPCDLDRIDPAARLPPGIVKLTDFRGTKPPYRVLRPGLAAHILGLSQPVMR